MPRVLPPPRHHSPDPSRRCDNQLSPVSAKPYLPPTDAIAQDKGPLSPHNRTLPSEGVCWQEYAGWSCWTSSTRLAQLKTVESLALPWTLRRLSVSKNTCTTDGNLSESPEQAKNKPPSVQSSRTSSLSGVRIAKLMVRRGHDRPQHR